MEAFTLIIFFEDTIESHFCEDAFDRLSLHSDCKRFCEGNECKNSPKVQCVPWPFYFKLHCHLSRRRRRPLPSFPPLRKLFLLAGESLRERLEKLLLFLFHFAVHSSHLQVQWLGKQVWVDSLFRHLRFLSFTPPDTDGFSLQVPSWHSPLDKNNVEKSMGETRNYIWKPSL